MRKNRHVIYIPGLGEGGYAGQRLAVRSWVLWGVRPQLFPINWADGEAFEPKFKRLLTLIDKCAKTGTVSLVCASAGASAALLAFAARQDKISGVVIIAGKIHNPGAIGGAYRSKNPAFVEAAYQVADALRKLEGRLHNVLSIRSLADGIVPARDSYLQGASNRVTPVMGHPVVIATQLVFGAPRFLRFLNQQ